MTFSPSALFKACIFCRILHYQKNIIPKLVEFHVEFPEMEVARIYY